MEQDELARIRKYTGLIISADDQLDILTREEQDDLTRLLKKHQRESETSNGNTNH